MPAGQASPLDFEFSFTNTVGNFVGTVTGLIEGLVADGDGQSATRVTLTSTGGLPDGASVSDPNVMNWTKYFGLFNVSGGVITEASLVAVGRPASSPGEVDDFFCLNYLIGGSTGACGVNSVQAHNILTLNNFDPQTGFNPDASIIGSDEVTFRQVDAQVPLPAAALNLALAALALAGVGRLRRRSA